MKKILVSGVMAGTLALLLSSCFVLQGFSILATSLHRGDKTKAQFVLHPAQEAAMYQGENIRNRYQFILVGVPTGGDLTVGKATWGTNGKFGGPFNMPRSGALSGANAATTIQNTCEANGLNFDAITGMAWKGFMTPNPVNDHGRVDVKSIVQVVVKAAADATRNTSYLVFGITGGWGDLNDDGIVNNGDFFWCTGIASSNVYVT